jgi:hypothetical protein
VANTIDFQSIDELQAALAKLTGPGLKVVGERAGYKVGLELQHKLQKKPGPSHQPVRWASKKQRAWYHWARKKDGLDLKYKRNVDPWSQKSSVSWAVQKTDGGAIVGNPATYAPWIYSHEYQQPMHAATGWTTDKQAADAVFREGLVARHVMAEVATVIHEAFSELLVKRIYG